MENRSTKKPNHPHGRYPLGTGQVPHRCDTCAARFDRDLICQRAWDYSATAFGCDPNDYEALRQAVIDSHGAAYELLAPPEEESRKRGKRRRR
jgi:hypothetical protein